MNHKVNSKKLVLTALLCAIGIVIPMFSPFKIILEPASFTLASHVPIFIAMFISPSVALTVAIGTTLGFLLGGFPIVIVLRALSHSIFAFLGGVFLKKHPSILTSTKSSFLYSLVIGFIHSICEVLVVIPFYTSSNLSQGYYDKGFLFSIMILIGLGTVVHSMVDLWISQKIWIAIPKSIINKLVITN
ncbi:MAG: ECF transporter S component [Clostridium perfringens]|nr:ECF transporter S component [Clostridium perfringens]